jgi:uncharacterized protein
MNHYIPVRKLQIDLSQGFPRHWHSGDAYKSCLFNTFSMLFPVIEDHFSDVMRGFIPELKTAGKTQLLRDVQAFLGQEATHRIVHQQYNAQLEKQGFFNWIEKSLLWRIDTFRNMSRLSKLSIVIGTEHFIGIIGDGLLRTNAWLEGSDEKMAKVWRWHAAEETEHKAVAFDLYDFAGGGYWRRVLWYLIISIALMIDLHIQTTVSLVNDGSLWRPRTWANAARFWFTRPGVVWQVLPMWLSYFSPKFHPWNHDNLNVLEAWRVKSEGDVRIVKAASHGQEEPAAKRQPISPHG